MDTQKVSCPGRFWLGEELSVQASEDCLHVTYVCVCVCTCVSMGEGVGTSECQGGARPFPECA